MKTKFSTIIMIFTIWLGMNIPAVIRACPPDFPPDFNADGSNHCWGDDDVISPFTVGNRITFYRPGGDGCSVYVPSGDVVDVYSENGTIGTPFILGDNSAIILHNVIIEGNLNTPAITCGYGCIIVIDGWCGIEGGFFTMGASAATDGIVSAGDLEIFGKSKSDNPQLTGDVLTFGPGQGDDTMKGGCGINLGTTAALNIHNLYLLGGDDGSEERYLTGNYAIIAGSVTFDHVNGLLGAPYGADAGGSIDSNTDITLTSSNLSVSNNVGLSPNAKRYLPAVYCEEGILDIDKNSTLTVASGVAAATTFSYENGVSPVTAIYVNVSGTLRVAVTYANGDVYASDGSHGVYCTNFHLFDTGNLLIYSGGNASVGGNGILAYDDVVLEGSGSITGGMSGATLGAGVMSLGGTISITPKAHDLYINGGIDKTYKKHGYSLSAPKIFIASGDVAPTIDRARATVVKNAPDGEDVYMVQLVAPGSMGNAQIKQLVATKSATLGGKYIYNSNFNGIYGYLWLPLGKTVVATDPTPGKPAQGGVPAIDPLPAMSAEGSITADDGAIFYLAPISTLIATPELSSINVFIQEGNVIVDSKILTIKTVSIYGISGQLLKTVEPESNYAAIAGLPGRQILIVKVVMSDGDAITKKIINYQL